MNTAADREGYLDAWRTIAVALVVASHLVQQRRGVSSNLGILGVHIFFFISGYVVSKSALREQESTSTFSIAGFYVRRVFRIIPPLMLYLVACAVLAVAGVIHAEPAQLVSGALYVCNIALVNCGWYAGHTWSLAFEEQFYLLFPLLLLLGARRSPAIVIWAAVAVAAALPALFFPVQFVGRTGFPLVYGLFAAGYWCARSGVGTAIWKRPTLTFLLSAAVTVLPLFIADPAIAKVVKFVYVLSIPAMVMAAGKPGFYGARLYALPLLVEIGQASYSIYLWQQLVAGPDFSRGPLLAQVGGLVLMVVACVTLFNWVERPMNAAGRQVSARMRDSREAAAREATTSLPGASEAPR